MKTHLCVCCCALRSNRNSHALSLSVMCLFMQTVRKKIQMYYPEVHFHPVTCFLSCLRRIAGVMGFSTGSDAESRGQCSGLPTGKRAAGSKDSQCSVLLAHLPPAGPPQTHGLHRAQVSLSHSQGSRLQSPEVPGQGHSLPGAQVMREEHKHRTPSPGGLSVHPPALSPHQPSVP